MYMNYAVLFLFCMDIYGCLSVWWAREEMLDEDTRYKNEQHALICFGVAWILQQVVFFFLAQYYISLWPRLLNEMGSLDMDTVELMQQEGFNFKGGVLVGDLDF